MDSEASTNSVVQGLEQMDDPKKGKTCHQCRQKTMDLVASCKAIQRNKLCPLGFCSRCLMNRYGEKAQEVETMDYWMCPKCRGKCNCSICRKNQGLEPTGILAPTAKASGLSSVSELLNVHGPANFSYHKKPKLDDTSIEVGSSNIDSVLETSVEVADVTKEKKNKAKATKKPKEKIQFEARLPQSVTLTSILGIVIPTEEAGNVLQFLEFCSTFGKALDLQEGQAQTVVRELFLHGRRQQYCSVVQMIIRLLKLISEDRKMSLPLSATDDSWFIGIGEILSQSEVSIDEFPPQTFVAGVAEYEKMDGSRRLKLLNFLCDESLTTSAMREYIKNHDEELKAKDKEAKQTAAAIKEKEKQLKQNMQCDVGEALIEENIAPLSIEDHNLIISQTGAEDEEMVEAKAMTSGRMLIRDVLRTQPIMLEDNGLILWKLNCYKEEEPNILLQDLGTFDDLSPHERWSTFKPEEKVEIENHISYQRKLIKMQKKKDKIEKNKIANAEVEGEAEGKGEVGAEAEGKEEEAEGKEGEAEASSSSLV